MFRAPSRESVAAGSSRLRNRKLPAKDNQIRDIKLFLFVGHILYGTPYFVGPELRERTSIFILHCNLNY